MLLPELIQMIETHADKLTAEIIGDLKSNPRTSFLHSRSTEDLERRARDIYGHLGRWLAEKDAAEIDGLYGEAARRLHAENVPLSEVVSVIILLKRHLLDFIQRNVLADSASELYRVNEIRARIGEFFDEGLYAATKTYESIHPHWEDPKLM